MASDVTIIVTPRDRFSCTEAALASIYANTPPIFDLIFVDAGSPAYVRQYLDAAQKTLGFRLIHAPWGIAPNHARNLALPHSTGRYIVFIDNDVMVAPGWLEALVACADETDAGIVSPLVYLGEMEQRIVHLAGGEMSWETRDGQRWLNESHRHFNTPQAQIKDQFKREPCGYAEFHCMLIRKSVLDEVALKPQPLDEALLGFAEHIDLSLRVAEAGHEVWFEPAAQITFLTPRPAALSDLPYTRLRWSRDWTERSVTHFQQQWRLHPDCPAVAGARNFGITHLAAQQLCNEPEKVDHFLAQTKIQLYDQCAALGYSRDALALLRRAYECAQRWFGHLYRSCGRPFLSHVVGSASLLAAHGAPAQLVTASLLHCVQTCGSLAADGKGVTTEKRQQVAKLVTPEVEYWTYLYAVFDWHGTDIKQLTINAERLVFPAGKTILIRLANDLEEYVSLSTRYSPQADDALRRWLPLYIEVAKLLEMPQLAARVQNTIDTDKGLSAPLVLQAPKRKSQSI